MHSLPIFIKLTGRPVILMGEGAAADAKRRLLERAGAVVVGVEGEASLAIVALEDEVTAVAAAAQLRARGILVNVADKPELCDFTMPAIVDRDPVLIAVGTGGASAGLAKALRQRIEALVPHSVSGLARALREARGAMRARWPDATQRRHAVDEAFDAVLDPLVDKPADAVARWLAAAGDAEESRCEIVPITSDDPDDLTLRAARLLARADRIYHDGAIGSAILQRARVDAVRITGSPPAALAPGLSVHLVRKADR